MGNDVEPRAAFFFDKIACPPGCLIAAEAAQKQPVWLVIFVHGCARLGDGRQVDSAAAGLELDGRFVCDYDRWKIHIQRHLAKYGRHGVAECWPNVVTVDCMCRLEVTKPMYHHIDRPLVVVEVSRERFCDVLDECLLYLKNVGGTDVCGADHATTMHANRKLLKVHHFLVCHHHRYRADFIHPHDRGVGKPDTEEEG